MFSNNLKTIIKAVRIRSFTPSILYNAFCAINIGSYEEELEDIENSASFDSTNLYIIEYFRNHLSNYLKIIDYFSPDDTDGFSYYFCKVNGLSLEKDTYTTMMQYTQHMWPVLRRDIIACLVAPDFPCPVSI